MHLAISQTWEAHQAPFCLFFAGSPGLQGPAGTPGAPGISLPSVIAGQPGDPGWPGLDGERGKNKKPQTPYFYVCRHAVYNAALSLLLEMHGPAWPQFIPSHQDLRD